MEWRMEKMYCEFQSTNSNIEVLMNMVKQGGMHNSSLNVNRSNECVLESNRAVEAPNTERLTGDSVKLNPFYLQNHI